MKKKNANFYTMTVCVMVVMAIAVSGCTTLGAKEPAGASSSSSSAAAKNASAPAAPQAVTKEISPIYYDFGDVMLPRELTLEKKETFVMKTAGMTSGVMVLKGVIDTKSLVTFFESKMPVDGWHKMGSLSSARSIMLFEKTNRWCVIGISEGSFTNKVEIWVAPMENEGAVGRPR
ncbi:MAG: hypothetical protein M0036_08765 [Desulfobacteraceae bacterium]|nr:hypothetical protein [Desulfobacteraceae bacterium]